MRELLAALAHERWSSWMRYLFSYSAHNSNGSVTIPPRLAARWRRQMGTPYSDLPEAEKEADTREADRVIEVLEELE